MGLRNSAVLGLMLIVLSASGCGDNEFQPPPPPMVTVAAADVRDVTEYAEFVGTTDVATSIDIRARVSGILQEVRFESGTLVEAGDSLFLIDPEPFVAQRDAIQAKVESAEAELKLAETRAERIERSARDGAVSELQALEARAEADAAAAALKVAQKDLAIRQLDVDYTEIAAPISGFIEKSPFDVGDLVGNTADASLLTTIYDDSKIDVYFSVPDRVYLQATRQEPADTKTPVVEIGTEIDDGFPFLGEIDYFDPTVDEATGTIRIRAVVDNPDRRLVGGLFVRIRLPIGTIEDALLIPQAAIGADQIGSYVLVVDDAGVVERREVELGPVDGTHRVITSGIIADDRVVVRGLLRARPGATVDPQPVGP